MLLEQIRWSTLHEITAVWTLTSHVNNHPSKTNMSSRKLLENQGRTQKGYSSMGVPVLTDQQELIYINSVRRLDVIRKTYREQEREREGEREWERGRKRESQGNPYCQNNNDFYWLYHNGRFILGWFGLVLWHINRCRLFNAKYIFIYKLALFQTIQFNISTQFKYRKQFYFEQFSLA